MAWQALAMVVGKVLEQLDKNKQGYGNTAQMYGTAMNIANLMNGKGKEPDNKTP